MSAPPLSGAEIRRYYDNRVPKLKKTGGELRGVCPIHKGTRDSLAIKAETGEWYCHSECARGGSIFDFEAELNGTDAKTAREEVYRIVGRSSGPSTPHRIDKTYDYTDEQGKLLYQCVRYVPKDFKQRRPDGAGDWIWNLQGVRFVLYQLPAVIAAPIVFVVEGEKDADALTALGVVATCNPMGAGKWRSDYPGTLRDKEVVIVPDADEPGRKHAQQVARSLTGKAATLKILTLPVGKDVSDWIAQGGTLEQLAQLVEGTPNYVPAAGKRPVTTVSDCGDWSRLLTVNQNGEPISNLENVRLVLGNHPQWKGILRYNLLNNKVEIKQDPPFGKVGSWTDAEMSETTCWLQQNAGLKYISTNLTSEGVVLVARRNAYHPIRDYLNSLVWDGQPRVARWLTDYAAVADTPLISAIGTKWLISAVARAMLPGCKADSVLLLQGDQGIGKSMLFRILAIEEEWFTDDLGLLGTKDSVIQIGGSWIVEMGELHQAGTLLEREKAFISRTTDKIRLPYGRARTDTARQNVFCSTTNAFDPLQDSSGNRRWWPARCDGKLNLRGFQRIVPQLWAEAMALYNGGGLWHFAYDDPLMAALAEELTDWVAEDLWEPALLPMLTRAKIEGNPIQLIDALKLIQMPLKDARSGTGPKIGAIFRRNGFKPIRGSAKTGKLRGWVYCGSPVDDQVNEMLRDMELPDMGIGNDSEVHGKEKDHGPEE